MKTSVFTKTLVTGLAFSALMACESIIDLYPSHDDRSEGLTLVAALDTLTGINRLKEVRLSHQGRTRSISSSEFNPIVVRDYALNPSVIPTLLSVPEKADAPAGIVEETGYQPSPPPLPGQRLALLTDDVLNSFLTNISNGNNTNDALPGLVFGFAAGSLENGPGPDLLIVDVSAAIGDTSNVCPGVPSRGGDRFFISGIGENSDKSAVYEPSDYVDLGPTGTFISYGNATLTSPDVQLTTASALEQIALQPLAVVDNTRLFGVAVDLSDLGFSKGERVEQLQLSSFPVAVNAEGETRTCFDIDPSLIVGLPSVKK